MNSKSSPRANLRPLILSIPLKQNAGFRGMGLPRASKKTQKKTSVFKSILGVILGALGIDFGAFLVPKIVKKSTENQIEFSTENKCEKRMPNDPAIHTYTPDRTPIRHPPLDNPPLTSVEDPIPTSSAGQRFPTYIEKQPSHYTRVNKCLMESLAHKSDSLRKAWLVKAKFC